MAEFKKNGDTPHTLVINADNGPENSGLRSQWLKRLLEFSARVGDHSSIGILPSLPQQV